jgi:hypothetical protein
VNQKLVNVSVEYQHNHCGLYCKHRFEVCEEFVSGQLPVVSGQLPVVSGQWSVVSGQWLVASG